jgi:hypothetical protein
VACDGPNCGVRWPELWRSVCVSVPQLKKVQEEAAKKEAERKARIDAVDVKEGDYQVQVHIIEVRDLKAEDLNGTSDPVVFAEVPCRCLPALCDALRRCR